MEGHQALGSRTRARLPFAAVARARSHGPRGELVRRLRPIDVHVRVQRDPRFVGRVQSRGHRLGPLPAEGSQADPDQVPPEVAQAPQGLRVRPDADVALQVVWRGLEGERGCHPQGLPRETVLKDSADLSEARVVHEHEAVHQLHAGRAAGQDHLAGLLRAARQRLLHQHVAARGRGLGGPLRVRGRGQGHVHDVQVEGEQGLVTPQPRHAQRQRELRAPALALVEVTGGHGHQLRVARPRDGARALPGDCAATQDADARLR
mmetsp:Transcript_38915/g.108262  ORF Transcript_38915/g.108262 Transcript_38915/m.108262 type:complete len:262 (-) Transcript_38915:14-799(-)